MILCDAEIKDAVLQGSISIEPFDASLLQPASYDLHLDNDFRIFKPHKSEFIDPRAPVGDLMEPVRIEDGDHFVLHPGNFALGLVREKTGVDAQHVGRLEGKSSLARLGLIIHTTAGFLDPGNNLKLTLELFNASPLPIRLYPGMKVAQIAFERMSRPCDIPYGDSRLGSKYYGDEGISESKMHLNFAESEDA